MLQNKCFYLFLQRNFKIAATNLNKNMNKTKKMEKKTILDEMRTPSEIERERKHKRICQEYLRMRSDYPEVSVYRIFSVIAERVGMTQMGVMRILQRRNLYHIQRSR